MLRVNSQKSKVKDQKPKVSNQSGFTLIEFLIYSVLVAMFMGVLILMNVNIIQGNASLNTINEVNNNTRFSLGIITYHIRQANDFSIPNDETLELAIEGNDDITFFLEEEVLKIQKGEEEAEALIDSEIIKVNDLTFTDLSYPGTVGTIRIKLSLKRKNPLGRAEYEFQTTTHTTENLNFSAAFTGSPPEEDPEEHNINCSVGVGSGTTGGDCGSAVPHGSSATVEAIPDESYDFDQWSGDTTSSSSSYTFNNVTGDINVTANFEESWPDNDGYTYNEGEYVENWEEFSDQGDADDVYHEELSIDESGESLNYFLETGGHSDSIGSEIFLSTVKKIDLAPFESINISVFNYDGTGYEDRAWVAICDNIDDGYHDCEDLASGNNHNFGAEGVVSLDVQGYSDEYYIAVGGRLMAVYPGTQQLTFDIDKIWLDN